MWMSLAPPNHIHCWAGLVMSQRPRMTSSFWASRHKLFEGRTMRKPAEEIEGHKLKGEVMARARTVKLIYMITGKIQLTLRRGWI